MKLCGYRGWVGVSLIATLILGMPAVGRGQQDVDRRLRDLEEQVRRLEHRVAGRDSLELARLRRQIEALTREIERLKLGEQAEGAPGQTIQGFAPGAAKVYGVGGGVSIGGYGEALYQNFASRREDGRPSALADRVDLLRGVFYVGYKFGSRLLFNSEVEYEHATTDESVGEVGIEFAYLDYRLSDAVGLRAGLLLIPMGLINEMHEPPTFLGTTRPETERQILPSTWRENGLGLFGQRSGFAYRAYLVNGFDAVGAKGSTAEEGFGPAGLRGGRQNGAEALANDFAGVARLDYVGRPGVQAGGSVYLGKAGQGRAVPGEPGRELDVRTFIGEGHVQYRAHGLDLRGLVALASLSDVAELNAARAARGEGEPGETVGERLIGGYVQVGFNVLRSTRTEHELVPYVRFEVLNTQDRVPPGFVRDPANDRRILSLGAAWRPIPEIVVKADYQIHDDRADTGVNRLNAVVGYLF